MITPYYLIDEKKLLRNLEVIRRVREVSGAKSVLALKCFSTWSVFGLMKRYLDGTTSSGVYEARLGREGRRGHRIRPDGYELAWRQIGVLDVMEDPQLPFFVQWTTPADHHPSTGGGAVAIERVEMNGDADTISEWLGADHDLPLDEITVEWVEEGEPGLNAVWFATAHGSVRID